MLCLGLLVRATFDQAFLSTKVCTLFPRFVQKILRQPRDGLREINVNTMIIDQNALHLEIGLLTVSLICEFDEGILEGVACPFIAYDFAR